MADIERASYARAPVGRVCAICGRAGGVQPLTLQLKWLGIAGQYAHPHCVRKAKAVRP